MESPFCTFMAAGKEREVVVNVMAVTHVKLASPNECFIIFDKDNVVTVSGSLSEVRAALENAVASSRPK